MSSFGWSDVILKYKASVIDKCKFVTECNLPSVERVELAGRYTEPVIIQKSKAQTEKYYREHVRSAHATGSKPLSQLISNDKNQSIRIDQLFSPDSDGNKPKYVILKGDSGIGKSLMLQKIMLDWASREFYSENFDVIFLLKCDEVKCLSQKMSLNELLSWSCSLTSDQISEILKLTPEKVLILIDGIEYVSHPPSHSMLQLTNPSDRAQPMDILRSVLKGILLPESFMLVTTRSIAADALMNLLKGPQRFTEIMGFSERGVQEYFQKFFQDEKLLKDAFESVKTNESLLTACSVPLLCWMVCFCLKKHFTDDDHVMRELKTTTSIYVHFVFTLLEHHDQSQSALTMLRSLGQLAEERKEKQQVFFDEESVAKTGLDPATTLFLYKGSLKIKDKQEPVFRFMHSSFQEFFTALYYVLLDEERSWWKIHGLFPRVEWGDKIYRPSPARSNPIPFLCGLLNEEVSSSIFEKIKSPAPHIKTLKEKLVESVIRKATHRGCELLFALHCLYELQDERFVREALKTHKFIDLSNISLRSTDCWVLLYCLPCYADIRDLILMYCDLTAEKLKILQPVLCMCEFLSSSALDEHVSLLLSSFHSVGLKTLHLKLVSLNESWASGIISLVQICTSLQQLSVSVFGLLLEEGLMLLEKSLTNPHCTVIIEGMKCSKPTDQCKEQDWSHSCNKKVKIHFKPKVLEKLEE
ncbi:LRR and PYD domains-containing 3-like protein [Labeo rohita]|uniref:LRR and PYD domains-containing 3-like protein n=1 Tax=Labeo rohita TaxID=84645 RepID=A0A498ML90_LABRO|nr:LRR and PYD domains-containing 3-like protein [Labeo rohita]